MFYKIVRIILFAFIAADIICCFFPIIYIPHPDITDRDLVYADHYRNAVALINNGSVSIGLFFVNVLMPLVSIVMISRISDPKAFGWRAANILAGLFMNLFAFMTWFALTFVIAFMSDYSIELTLTSAMVLLFTALSGWMLILFGIVPKIFRKEIPL
ncbi:MAG TPA: hypothetical protein VL651_00450 [Bacteroidia bacterium]|jgi:hypothetical protein|nr:hypothetical protein [Bacteroidia bacterium]